VPTTIGLKAGTARSEENDRMIGVGSAAPDFSASTERGKEVRLRDALAHGPLVLIFYPGDSTPVCTKQLCSVRDDSAKYEAAGITVFGVNNADAESHWRFIAQNRLSVRLLVDRDLKISSDYGCVLGFGPLRIINRTVVGIGRDGTIVYYKRGNPTTDEIISGLSRAA
jgi:peroxiredoxin Q/BCP